MTQSIGTLLEGLRQWFIHLFTKRQKREYLPGMYPAHLSSLGFALKPTYATRAFNPLVVMVGGPHLMGVQLGAIPYEVVDYVWEAEEYVPVYREAYREHFIALMQDYWDRRGAMEIVMAAHRFRQEAIRNREPL